MLYKYSAMLFYKICPSVRHILYLSVCIYRQTLSTIW